MYWLPAVCWKTMSSRLDTTGGYTTSNLCGGSDYSGYVSMKGSNTGPQDICSPVWYHDHCRKTEEKRDTIDRKCDKNLIIRMTVFIRSLRHVQPEVLSSS